MGAVVPKIVLWWTQNIQRILGLNTLEKWLLER